MSHTSAASESSVLEDTTVIDVDVHRPTGYEDRMDYLDEPYRSRVRAFLDGPKDFKPRVKSGWNAYLEGVENRPATPEAIHRHVCEEFHVDHPIINSSMSLPSTSETDLALELMKATNDSLLDLYLDEYDHFRGVMVLTTQEPEVAAEEVDRLADEDQLVGAFITSTGPVYPLGDPRYDVVYEALEDHDLPVMYHGGGGKFVADFPVQNQALHKYMSVSTLVHPWSQMLTLTSLVVNGVPEKFPDLEFVLLEAGIGWVPYMTYRLNSEYDMRRKEAPLLQRSPESYIRDQFYFGTQPIDQPEDPEHLYRLIEMVGADSLMFATDYPHWDFDNPNTIDQTLLSYCSPEERERILSGTALEVFDV